MKKHRVINAAVAAVLALNLLTTAYLFYTVSDSPKAIRYTMYVGLNDEDTNTQVISYDEAMNIIETTCEKYVDGFTAQEAKEMWKDESGISTHEQTVVCYFYRADEADVYHIADELKSRLNQKCVLIEKAAVSAEYY